MLLSADIQNPVHSGHLRGVDGRQHLDMWSIIDRLYCVEKHAIFRPMLRKPCGTDHQPCEPDSKMFYRRGRTYDKLEYGTLDTL